MTSSRFRPAIASSRSGANCNASASHAGGFARSLWCGVILLALAAAPSPLSAQIINEKDRARFIAEADPIRKAKALPKYGEQQFILMREELRKEKFTDCLALLEQYRDAVKVSFTKLKETGRNAERKPDGFRQMQIHLRQSVNHLGPILQAVPYELRGPFESIRRELEAIDRELLSMLFPPKPGGPRGSTVALVERQDS